MQRASHEKRVDLNSKIQSTLTSLRQEFTAFRNAPNEALGKKIVDQLHELTELVKPGKFIESNWTQLTETLDYFKGICLEILTTKYDYIKLTHPILYAQVELLETLSKQELGKVQLFQLSVNMVQNYQVLTGVKLGQQEEYVEAHRLLKLAHKAYLSSKTLVTKSTAVYATKNEESFLPHYYAYLSEIDIHLGKYKKINKLLMQGLNYYYTLEHPNLRYNCANVLIVAFKKAAMYLSSMGKHNEAIIAFEVVQELSQDQLQTPVQNLKVMKFSEISIKPDAYTGVLSEKHKDFLNLIPIFIKKEESKAREQKAKYIQDKVEKICARIKCNYDSTRQLLILSAIDNKEAFLKVLQDYRFKSATAVTEEGIHLPIDETNPKSIYLFCERVQALLEQPAAVTSPQDKTQDKTEATPVIVDEPKKEKIVPPAPTLSEPAPAPAAPVSKIIKWNNPAIPDTDAKKDYPPYFRIYGNSHIRTYGFFNQKSMESIPEEAILLKAESEALKGRVLSKNNRKGKQGFKPRGDDLVLKLLGKFGDHRFPGKEIARGKIYKNGVPTGKEAQLYEFDYVHKGHKRLVAPKG